MRACSVCRSPSRALVEASLLDGEPLRSLAERFSVSKDALHRHRRRHLSAATLAAHAARLLDDLPSSAAQRRPLHSLRRIVAELAERASPKLPDPSRPEIRLPAHWTPEDLQRMAAGAFPDDGEPDE